MDLIGKPDSNLEAVFILLVLAMTAVMVMNRAATAMGAKSSNMTKSLGVVAFTALTTIVALVAYRFYLAWRVSNPTGELLLAVAVAALAILALAIPFGVIILRMNYLQSLFAAILTIAAVVFMAFLVKAGIAAIREGSSSMGKAKVRKENINDMPWR